LFYFRQDPQGTQAALSDTAVVQPTPSEQPAQDVAPMDTQSQESAKQICHIKRFQTRPKGNMSYEEYDEMLTSLKADLNSTLPTFVRHAPNDESFRQEVAGALRDYTAAQVGGRRLLGIARCLRMLTELTGSKSNGLSANTYR